MRREKTLEELVWEKASGEKGFYRVLREVYKEASEGKIKLKDPSPPLRFRDYLGRLDYSLWFWTTTLLVALTLISIALSNILPPLTYVRYVLGSVYVLFIPGYAFMEALYPEEKGLKPLEKLALSIGLSLALVPLIGLVLNYTPWGIRLEPIIASTSSFTFTMLLVGAYRKFSILSLIQEARVKPSSKSQSSKS